jgi:hypothetical protein
MILTTNRVGAFDAAFKSRIHLAIKYPALSFDSRRDLWITFITSGHTHPFPEWWNDAFLNTLAAEPLNGRQIKNIVRTAYALAMAEESNIRPQDIEISLQSIKDFEEDFARDVADAEREIARPNTPSASEHRAKRRRQE